MRKILKHFAIFTAASSSILPVTACTFNFYVDRATEAAIRSFANQTSNVVKSLVLSKEKSVDTAQTTNDIFNKVQNSSISNLTTSQLKNVGDFNNAWGENNNINYQGFNPNDYFVPTGAGSLTSMVNGYLQTNSTLAGLKYATSLSITDNSLLYGQFQNNNEIKNLIYTFLNNAKKNDPAQMDATSIYIRNLVLGKNWTVPDNQSFKKNVVNPLSFMLDYLVDNKWSATEQGPTPKNTADLRTFMNNWKDPDGKNYSEWISSFSGNWSLGTQYYSSWNSTDFNFYRSGVLLNWLFYKIGKDYQIKNPTSSSYQDRYLGGIISNHVTISPIGINIPELEADLAQYLPHLLENPLYLITIFHAIIPILKYFGFNGDADKGTNSLIFGSQKTDKSSQKYNFGDLIENLQNLINNPDKLKDVIKTLMGWAPAGTAGRSFLYDISVGKFIIFYPLGDLLKVGGQVDEPTKNNLVDSLITLLSRPDIKGTINTIANVYNEWVKPYNDKKQSIEINLNNLRNFLTNPTNGLINVINQDFIIGALFPILTNSAEVDQAQYNLFYQGLGGQLPNPLLPLNFKPNSILDLLHKNISNYNTPLGKISLILFGNSNTGARGIFEIIIDSNNEWIENNYIAYFDPENEKTGKTTDQKMTTEISNNIITSKLQYKFSFFINNKTYIFAIKCISHDNAITFKGNKTFRFTDIDLISIN